MIGYSTEKVFLRQLMSNNKNYCQIFTFDVYFKYKKQKIIQGVKMDEIELLAYHGTDTESAKNIIKTQKFNKSNNIDDWLGSGVYFYDNLNNAILYNIRKYKNKKKTYPTYKDISEKRKIIVTKIRCKIEDIVDLNDMDSIRKFLGLWKMFYDNVKNNPGYKASKYKDGYMINWLLENTDYFKGGKIFINIFTLDLRFKRKINNIFNNKTRIGYTLQQKYICIIDDSCIETIELYNKDYEIEYNKIKDLTNNILIIGE